MEFAESVSVTLIGVGAIDQTRPSGCQSSPEASGVRNSIGGWTTFIFFYDGKHFRHYRTRRRAHTASLSKVPLQFIPEIWLENTVVLLKISPSEVLLRINENSSSKNTTAQKYRSEWIQAKLRENSYEIHTKAKRFHYFK